MPRDRTGCPTKWTSEKKATFLRLLASGTTVEEAASACGVARSGAYELRNTDPQFAKEWEAARNARGVVLEEEARRRALNGSDVLLIFLLKGHFPDRYRDNIKVEHALAEKLRKLAEAEGLDADEVVAEANRILEMA